MKRETAAQISKVLWDVHGQLNDAIWLLKKDCQEAEFKRLRKEIAKAMSIIGMNVLRGIYSDYPDLQPPELGNDRAT